MKLLGQILRPVPVRLFLCSWIVLSLHFATNTVREHYPAFSLIDEGTFRVDSYTNYHSDIFVYEDGHAYINNNVAASVVAAVPLLIFDPLLDALEAYEKERNARLGTPSAEYRVDDHPNSRYFFQLAQEAGMVLRFGAATAVTSVLLMAPLSALIIMLMYQILLSRGVAQKRSVALALLFGFGTPLFFRTGVLNHNTLVMYATFAAFVLLWVRPGELAPVAMKARVAAGFLAGLGLALDYSGVVPLLALFGYLIASRLRTATARTSIMESVPFVLASVPPVLFLLYSQWAMFGNPFMPAQYWMPDVTFSPNFGREFANAYSTTGFRGFTWPSVDLLLLNLFDPTHGLYTYGPLLMLGLIPAWFYGRASLVLPPAERIFVAVFFAAFLAFCSANQYARVQFNSGFRYMVPLVPFIFLAASDHLARLSRLKLALLSLPVLLHSWVISMVREPVPESWLRFLTEGFQLPWLTVIRRTAPEGHPVFGSFLLPIGALLLTAAVIWGIWRIGTKAEDELVGNAQP